MAEHATSLMNPGEGDRVYLGIAITLEAIIDGKCG